jgi:AhpC/TSA family
MITRYQSAVKWTAITLSVLIPLWLIGCATIYHVMRQPPEQFGHAMARIPGPVAFMVFPFETMWMKARGGTLSIGDPAPDFTLTKIDKTGQVQLSSFAAQKKPVVLVFGSYT